MNVSAQDQHSYEDDSPDKGERPDADARQRKSGEHAEFRDEIEKSGCNRRGRFIARVAGVG